MSSTYTKIAECAQRISQVVYSHEDLQPPMTTSGRSPVLPEAALHDLIPAHLYEQLDATTRVRLSDVLQERLLTFRDYLWRQYSDLTGQHRSLVICGLNDLDMEKSLIQIFETRYKAYLDEVRGVLKRLVKRGPCDFDNRNTRGGFGDVSPPS
jgi:hypothetical protein